MSAQGNDQLERELEAALARLTHHAVPDDTRVPAPPWAERTSTRRGAADVRRFGRATPWLVAAVLLVVAGVGVGATVAYDASAPDTGPVTTRLPSPTATRTDDDGTLGDVPTTPAPSATPSLDRGSNGSAPGDDTTSTSTSTGARTVGVGPTGR